MRSLISRFRKFKGFLGNQVWRLFFTSLFLGLGVFLVEASFVFVIQGFLQAIDLVPVDRLVLPSWYPRSLNSAVLMLLAFGAVRSVLYMVKFYLGGSTGKAFARLQRERIGRYALAHIEQVETAEVIAHFTEMVNEASSVLQGISQLILVGVSTLMFFVAGIKFAPVEMISGVALLLLAALPFRALGKKIVYHGELHRKAWDDSSRVLLRGLRHNFLFKIYGLLDREIDDLTCYLRIHETSFRDYFKIVAFRGGFPNFFGILVLCLITFISVRFLHTPGIILLSFFYLFIRLAQNASEMQAAISDIQVGFGGFKKVFHWHQRLEDALRADSQFSSDMKRGVPSLMGGITVEFDRVDFGYATGDRVLSDLSFSVSSGDVLLVKGESGVGKSTLLMLMIGGLKPVQGRVLINGRPVEEVREELYREISYVGPEPYMIAGSLKDNLLFGHYDPLSVTDDELLEAVKKAQLNESRFQLGLHIDEQTPLSTGQKQRIAIARAIVRKPKLLILDEATANLDEATEAAFLGALRPWVGEITTLVISHKNSFDSLATRRLDLFRGGYRVQAVGALH